MYDTSLQVMIESGVLVTKYLQNISSLCESSLLDVWVLKAVLRILSYILEAQIPSSRLTMDVLHITRESVLVSQTLLEHQYDLHKELFWLLSMYSIEQAYCSKEYKKHA